MLCNRSSNTASMVAEKEQDNAHSSSLMLGSNGQEGDHQQVMQEGEQGV